MPEDETDGDQGGDLDWQGYCEKGWDIVKKQIDVHDHMNQKHQDARELAIANIAAMKALRDSDLEEEVKNS